MVGDLRLSTSSQCIKYLLFIFNLLFVITGIILLSIGSAIHGYYHKYAHFLDDSYLSVPSLLIAIGAIIFFIAFFGCYGAVRENYCMILTFIALLVLVFVLEFSAGISGYVLRSNVQETLRHEMLISMDRYNTSPEYKVFWDTVQNDFRCCGLNKPSDWSNEIPTSCCIVSKENCTTDSTNVFNTGCADVFGAFVKSHAVQLGSAGLAIAFMQALGIWFSIYLAKSIKKNYHNM